ncbi:histidine kinase [Enterococcus sp. RIT-PI-f]|nr:histidine kinase [Enterococcus sp. RIT-PI-f]
MLSVYICEDNRKQREKIEQIVKKFIMIEALDMKLTLSSDDPKEILDYVQQHPENVGLYFLDIDLGHEMNGMMLASELRELDDLGKIVFVTTHTEMSFLTFTYKIEAMDFIMKDQNDQLQEKVQSCIKTAYQRYVNDRSGKKKLFQVKIGDTQQSLSIDEIIAFEASTSAHRIIVYTENSEIEFYDTMKNVEKKLPNFYRSHKSYLININHVSCLKKHERVVEMSNGMECFVSVRALSKLVNILYERHMT